MTRQVSDITKRTRAIVRVERLKAELGKLDADYEVQVKLLKDRHDGRKQTKQTALETARAEYKELAGEECPL